jgi:hypothetical protein
MGLPPTVDASAHPCYTTVEGYTQGIYLAGAVSSEETPMQAVEHMALYRRGSYGRGGYVYACDGPLSALGMR